MDGESPTISSASESISQTVRGPAPADGGAGSRIDGGANESGLSYPLEMKETTELDGSELSLVALFSP